MITAIGIRGEVIAMIDISREVEAGIENSYLKMHIDDQSYNL